MHTHSARNVLYYYICNSQSLHYRVEWPLYRPLAGCWEEFWHLAQHIGFCYNLDIYPQSLRSDNLHNHFHVHRLSALIVLRSFSSFSMVHIDHSSRPVLATSNRIPLQKPFPTDVRGQRFSSGPQLLMAYVACTSVLASCLLPKARAPTNSSQTCVICTSTSSFSTAVHDTWDERSQVPIAHTPNGWNISRQNRP